MTEPADVASIEVEVAYGEPERQKLFALSVPLGTTAIEAARLSQMERYFAGLNIEASTLGVFGTKVPPAHVLSDGDRVEIYRPLRADPREVRRQLALLGKTMGRGGKTAK